MISIVYMNDDSKELLSSDDVKDDAYVKNILKNSLTHDQIVLVDAVVSMV